MRLLLAARLSRISDGQTGIETQDRVTKDWAERNGHEVIHVAADKKSGTSNPWDRPNLKAWMTEPDKLAQYDGVVAHRLDRLSRGDDESTSAIEDWARKHKKVLLTEDGLVYPCEGAEGIRWDVTKRIAHEEWLKTSERYRRMQSHLRDNGFLVGDRPFGFRIVGQGEHKTLEPDPETAKYAVGMALRYIDGASLPDLCRWLDAEGVAPRHGGKWWPTGVRAILSNEALIGIRRHKGGKVVLKFKPLLSRETWDKLQKRLAENPRKSRAAHQGLLTGLICCGLCGRLMHNKAVYTLNKDGSKSYLNYYRCDGTSKEPSRCRNMIRADFTDENMASFVTDVLGKLRLYERTSPQGDGREDAIADVKQEIASLDPEAADYDEKLSELRSKLAELRNMPVLAPTALERDTGLSVGQYWDALADDSAKRRFLTAGKVHVLAVAELKAKKGQEPRPLQFSVGCEVGGDWSWR